MAQWPPEGCKDKASCGKHAMCMYIECRHSSVNLEKENQRLRMIVRVNGLRWGHTHEEIDAILENTNDN